MSRKQTDIKISSRANKFTYLSWNTLKLNFVLTYKCFIQFLLFLIIHIFSQISFEVKELYAFYFYPLLTAIFFNASCLPINFISFQILTKFHKFQFHLFIRINRRVSYATTIWLNVENIGRFSARIFSGPSIAYRSFLAVWVVADTLSCNKWQSDRT